MRKLILGASHEHSTVRGFISGWCYILRESFLIMLPVLLILLPCVSTKAASLSPTEETVIEEAYDEFTDDTDTSMDGSDTVSDSDISGQDSAPLEVVVQASDEEIEALNTIISLLSEEDEGVPVDETPVYSSLDEFEALPVTVSRYEYEILKRLEFLQYSQVILIGLIFILIFKKK